MQTPFLFYIPLTDAGSAMVHFPFSVIMRCELYNIAYLLTSAVACCLCVCVFSSSALKFHSFIRKSRQNFIINEFCAIRIEDAMFVKIIFTFLLKDFRHFRV
jgi:hypothetical protein